jgi:hypothetical protein
VLLSLKNVVVCHNGDAEKIKNKISSTIDDLQRIAKELKEKSCLKSANFIKEYSNSTMSLSHGDSTLKNPIR